MACYSRYYIRHYYGDVSFKETQFENGNPVFDSDQFGDYDDEVEFNSKEEMEKALAEKQIRVRRYQDFYRVDAWYSEEEVSADENFNLYGVNQNPAEYCYLN